MNDFFAEEVEKHKSVYVQCQSDSSRGLPECPLRPASFPVRTGNNVNLHLFFKHPNGYLSG